MTQPAHLQDALEEKSLPLQNATLEVTAKAGYARAVFKQTFRNPHNEALRVTYVLPLPAEAAVSGFAFVIGEQRVTGVVDGKAKAKERFESAIIEGRTAALLDQETSSLFRQELGNIPAGTSVAAEITIDMPLVWLAEGMWEFRFPLAAAPRYLGTQARTSSSIELAAGPVPAKASLRLSVADALCEGNTPESPTHPLQCKSALGTFLVQFGNNNQVSLDRDIAVRWSVAQDKPEVVLDTVRLEATHPSANSLFAICTLVPPRSTAKTRPVARDLVVLIDTSGSMSGAPLVQAQRIAMSLVESLDSNDSFELIAFNHEAHRYLEAPASARADSKRAAQTWIRTLVADGGTEMLGALEYAVGVLRRDSQKQIVLVTDGLVGFERQVTQFLVESLPENARLHAVGVGSATNRDLLVSVARAGRGADFVVDLDEDADRAAHRVLQQTNQPIVTSLTISGSGVRRTAPKRLPDLYLGAPSRIAVELDPNGGELVLRGNMADGAYLRRIRVESMQAGTGNPAIAKLFAREWALDLEMRILAGENAQEVEALIENVGKEFQIATRLTSWVAISEQVTVDPTKPTRHAVMPQMLPHGMSAESFGLRATNAPASSAGVVQALIAPMSLAAPMPRMAEASAPAAMRAVARFVADEAEEEDRTMAPRAAYGAPQPPAQSPRPAASYPPAPATIPPSPGIPVAPSKPMGSPGIPRGNEAAAPKRSWFREWMDALVGTTAPRMRTTLEGIFRIHGDLIVIDFQVTTADFELSTDDMVARDAAAAEFTFVPQSSTAAGKIPPQAWVRLVFRSNADTHGLHELHVALPTIATLIHAKRVA